MSPTSTKPYLLRALHEWCTDNGYTPYITVVVDERVVVPQEYVQDGQITLNVGMLATHKLELGNDYIAFQARFGGVARAISVPVDTVVAIFARETGQGMAFEAGSEGEAGDGVDAPAVAPVTETPTLSSVPTSDSSSEPDEPPPASPAPSGSGGGRARLKVVK